LRSRELSFVHWSAPVGRFAAGPSEAPDEIRGLLKDGKYADAEAAARELEAATMQQADTFGTLG